MAAAAGKGHRVLGAGSYGCTLAPDYPCASGLDRLNVLQHKQRGRSYVAKLVGSEKEMLGEWAHFQMVKRIDPDGVFTVPVIGHCSAPVPLSDIYEPRAEKCDHVTTDLIQSLKKTDRDKAANELRQLIVQYGGVDYWHAAATVPLPELLRALTPVMDGVHVMAANHVYHKDIRLPNIMYSEHTAKLIDFGMMVDTPQDLYSDYTINAAYEIWPPECDVLYKLKHGYAKAVPNSRKTYDAVLKQLFGGTYADVVEEVDTMSELLSVMDDYKYQTAVAYMVHNWASKFDVFSMGVAVAKLVLMYPTIAIPPMLVEWIAFALRLNAFDRWDAATAAENWRLLLKELRLL
jgi:hypothetical protein